jgi:RNA polymerase sigma factor (sigma-70 family)
VKPCGSGGCSAVTALRAPCALQAPRPRTTQVVPMGRLPFARAFYADAASLSPRPRAMRGDEALIGGCVYARPLMEPPSGQAVSRLSDESDELLIALTARHADKDAFALFFDRHHAKLTGWLFSHTGNVEIAEDLAAEAFATAFLKVNEFDGRRGRARAWLFGIARITLLSSYRQHAVEQTARRQLGVIVPLYHDDAWRDAEARLEETLDQLIAGLDELSSDERDAVIARIVEQRPYGEIALSANTTEPAMRKRVSRALKKLRALMQGTSE